MLHVSRRPPILPRIAARRLQPQFRTEQPHHRYFWWIGDGLFNESERQRALSSAAIMRLAASQRRWQDVAILKHTVTGFVWEKLRGPSCDLWSFWNRHGHKDADIHDHLWTSRHSQRAGVPDKIQSWALMITSALLTGNCDCWTRYAQGTRKRTCLEQTCRCKHSLSPLAHSGLAPLEYVQRAVHGRSNLRNLQNGEYRAFGDSMLGAVITDPSECGYVLDRNNYLVRNSVPSTARLQDKPASNGASAIVWLCERCKCVVGQEGAPCPTPSCVWVPVMVHARRQAGKTIRIAVHHHESDGHAWPMGEVCPVCSKQQTRTVRIAIFVPSFGCYDDFVPTS